MIDLKPCPFCGLPVQFNRGVRGEAYIYCLNRHYFQFADKFGFSYGLDNKEIVAEEWNKRVKE